MEWFRVYHGLCMDGKLRAVARDAKTSKANVIATWIALLEYASQAEPRGSLNGLTVGMLVEMCDVPRRTVLRIGDSFLQAGMVSSADQNSPNSVPDTFSRICTSLARLLQGNSTLTISAFDTRQAPSDTSAERVRRHREMRKNNTLGGVGNGRGNVTNTVTCNVTDPVTCNVTVTVGDSEGETLPLTPHLDDQAKNGVALSEILRTVELHDANGARILKGCRLEHPSEDNLLLVAPTKFIADHIAGRYGALIELDLRARGQQLRITYEGAT